MDKETTVFDLGTATDEMTRVVSGVADRQLDGPTPCADWSVADLLAHIHRLTTVFTQNARKEPVDPPTGLIADWRRAIPAQLDELARAWRQESAWQGRCRRGASRWRPGTTPSSPSRS